MSYISNIISIFFDSFTSSSSSLLKYETRIMSSLKLDQNKSTKLLQFNSSDDNYINNVITIFTDQISEPVRNWIQCLFDKFESNFDQTSIISQTLSAMSLTMCTFWLIGSFYTFIDYFQWPKFLYRYKIQDNNNPITLNEIIETAKIALWNQITVQTITTMIAFELMNYLPFDNNYRVPPVLTIIYHLIVFVFIQETLFYYLHRLLHHRLFYRIIHKIHHRWQSPIAISALYCHPIEHFLANLVPVLTGPFVMCSHRSIIAIWLIIVHIVTLNDHSGYHFPLLPSPEFHDYHHLMFNQNFGRMGFLDYFHGTSERYLKSKYSKRHHVLLSLTPMKVLIPDND